MYMYMYIHILLMIMIMIIIVMIINSMYIYIYIYILFYSSPRMPLPATLAGRLWRHLSRPSSRQRNVSPWIPGRKEGRREGSPISERSRSKCRQAREIPFGDHPLKSERYRED